MSGLLGVYRGDRCIGELWLGDDGRTMGFRYGEAARFAISNSLPLATGVFAPTVGMAHNWFANLLPEEASRQMLVNRLGVADDDFSLLAAIGGDCAGALRIVDHTRADALATAGREPVDPNQLARWAQGKERYALFQPGKATRLSLAGAQDKIPVIIEKEQLYLPLGAAASSHLIKFALKPALVFNELYMNRLARIAGLDVPGSHAGQAGRAHYLAVTRYDRERVANRIERVHQEDMCQALGYPRRLKYQEEGGPTLAACAALLRAVTAMPALQVRQLLRWQIFNVLAGNSDGHAKNLSLLQDASGRWSLAPAYDLVCTMVLPYSPSLGFAVGSNFHPQQLCRADWEELARAMGLAPPFVLRELRQMLDLLEPAANSAELRAELQAAGMDEAGWTKVQHVRKYVVQQCRRYRKL
ncbi:type II toxin-antitoxin system HipA family toxin [Pseudomonas lopnurensis]|uniref:type II toxin-antitoxin system HipA family toxin n=1 Tax=Pseudomonas lopnurensis TaxID=1477517 RepID=UPI00187AEFDD|nr:type II toxin-antitoxin system HipA family toxin [Pseudomonas lopnurensis]MBE7374451.1 type II toxin-antitoxin system HipA family toxin [Pseudomonas lopnurensis]